MNTLIELFDHSDPIFNVLVATAMRPQEIVYLTDQNISAELEKLKRYFELLGMDQIELRQVMCDLYDLADTADRLNAVVDSRDPGSCAFDSTGGDEAMLLAMGMVCARREVDTLLYCHESMDIQYLWGKLRQYRVPIRFRAGISARITLSGGERAGNGHIDISEVDQGFFSHIPQVFQVYLRHKNEWPRFVLLLQQMRKSATRDGDSICLRWANTQDLRTDHLEILMELAALRVIEHASITPGGWSFSLRSDTMLSRLCDVGSWLELYLYYQISQMPCFDDADMNVNLKWDQNPLTEDTRNELDVIATAGPNMFLISCKTGLPQMSALNEIATLTRRFGGRFAIPVLATTCNLTLEAPAIVRRAFDMDVEIIDRNDLEDADRLRARLTEIARYWNENNFA